MVLFLRVHNSQWHRAARSGRLTSKSGCHARCVMVAAPRVSLRISMPIKAPGKSPTAESTLRSEEHTSELQSLRHLVCRLLLEKKTKTDVAAPTGAAYSSGGDTYEL